MTITEFLSARMAGDEAEARYALDCLSGCAGVRISDPADGGDIGHLVAYSSHAYRHNPARVLREIDAMRRIIEIHQIGTDPCDAHNASLDSIPCDTILAVAAIWSDHADYLPEWSEGQP